MLIPDIPSDLFFKFNNIKFYDDVHKYYLGDKNLISVTTLLHNYKEPFDETYWSEVKAIEYGKTAEEVLADWKFINEKAKLKGSIVHNYAENLFQNKIYDYPKDKVIAKLNEDCIYEEFIVVKQYVDNFYKDCFNKLIPIKIEYIVYDELWGLAGMMDMLFWNVKKKCFQIYDWKTNKALELNNQWRKKLKGPLSDLDECEYSLYCCQLSAYKTIIERNTNIKIDGMYLVWLNEVNENYKIIECNDYSYKINMIMDNVM
jgi:hypothetical protein